jgi:subtilisin family serine protease
VISYKNRLLNQPATERKIARNLCACFFSLVILLLSLPASALAAGKARYVPGQLLVKPKPTLSQADFSKRLQFHGAQDAKKLHRTDVHVIIVPENFIEAVLAALRQDSGIEFAERDGIAHAAFVPNDTYVASGTEWHLAKIQAPQAWDFSTGGTNTIIAILDSGINAAHPEFAGRILPGYNFVSGGNDTSDDFGHGTAVAGTAIAAGNNGIGVAGVAYGCSVLPVKVVNSSGFASYSAVSDGIRYAVDHGARIINLSIAGTLPSSTLQSAVDYAWSNNVVVVAAAGNNATSDPQYPAACDHVVGVSATEPDDSLASFSSYGSTVTLAAPGDNIWTTYRDLSTPYASWSGTSFSSPIVAAVAALVASVNPSLLNTEIVSLLEQTADDLGSAGYDPLFGYGRVNAWSAVIAAAAAPGAQLITNSPPSGNGGPPGPVPPVSTNTPVGSGTVTISIQINGRGFTTPNLNGKTLRVGQICNLRAVPAPGQVFAGWNGFAGASPFPHLAFVAQSNLTLVAHFVPSPFLPSKGNFAGLLANTNGVTPEDSGYFGVSVTQSGMFSGRLLVGGSRYTFHNQFNASGDAVVTIRRRLATPLVLALHLDLAGGSDQITGSVTAGAWTSELSGDRNVFNSRLNPPAQAGLRSFLLEQSGDSSSATATGSSRIYQSGATRVRGKLADLRPFNTASSLARNGDYPFYLSMNRGSEVVIGWLNFPAGQNPVSSGTVFWVKSGTNAFAKSLQVTSSP